jgi:hypothetical protein
MTKMPSGLVRFVALPLFASPLTLLGQAGIEYALKSAGAVSISVGSAVIAGCQVDSALLTCLNHYYPRTVIVSAAVIFVLVVRWLTGMIEHRAR